MNVNLDDLTIGQARQLVAQFGTTIASAASVRTDHGLQIAVLDRGFVYIGYVETDGEWAYITKGHNIRRWGTTRGLGELVNGPTPETKLDPVGRVRVPMTSLQHLIAVEVGPWLTELS